MWTRRCPAYNKRSVNPEVGELFVDIVDRKTEKVLVNLVHSERIHPLMVNGCIVPCKLDTGAQANVLSQNYLKHFNYVPKVHKTAVSLKGYDGGDIPIMGRCVGKVSHKGKFVNVSFVVVPGKPAMLGDDTCERLGLVKRVYVVDDETVEVDYSDLLDEYKEVFQGLGCLEGEYAIIVDENVTPVIHPATKVPFALKCKLKDELERMEKLEVIERVETPTDWVSSLVLVEKKNVT